ncbi:hypothetical protein NPIL_637861, partial [Nephila pilipes]
MIKEAVNTQRTVIFGGYKGICRPTCGFVSARIRQ